uniref:Uncharacterized protein n=1 Tax=Arundo donax TaxID=35708 RepID=A0A0A9C1B2_ARUDO
MLAAGDELLFCLTHYMRCLNYPTGGVMKIYKGIVYVAISIKYGQNLWKADQH